MTEQASMVGAVRERQLDHDEIDRLIESRASTDKGKVDADEQEESWKESVRQFHAENREARRHQWVSYYRTLSESLRWRSEECAAKAAALDRGEGSS